MNAYCSLVSAYLFIMQPILGELAATTGPVYQSWDRCEQDRNELTNGNSFECTPLCAVSCSWGSELIIPAGEGDK